MITTMGPREEYYHRLRIDLALEDGRSQKIYEVADGEVVVASQL